MQTLTDRRWLRITIDPVVNGDRFEGAVCVLSDIDAEKRRDSDRDAAYDREKRIAESLQHALLTPLIERSFENLEVASLYVPAWDEAQVGGDLFDVFALDDNRVALIVADASGKGLAAAARTAEVKFAMRAFLWEDSNPASAMARLNDFVCRAQHAEGRAGFVTASLVTIDRYTGATIACVAGAELPLLCRENGETAALGNSGIPLGIEAGLKYEAFALTMNIADTLVLATDGITEARCDRAFFGYEGMTEVAQRQPATMPLMAVGHAILGEAKAFARGAFHDDVCLLLARRCVPTDC